jgi:predicted HicB family RNase H-like nuclease
MKQLDYKGYTGSIEYSKEDDILYGKVLGIKSLISYEGKTGKELENDFKEAIDAYISDCKNEGISPEKPFKGSFNVRISPELHQKAALLAFEEKITLNNLVAESIKERINKDSILKDPKKSIPK